MAKLKRDERACPFCGEAIKAVAIRCRFCQSDIEPLAEAPSEAPSEATPESDAPAPPPPPAVEEPEPAARQAVGRKRLDAQQFVALIRANLTVALASLVTVAAIGVGVNWWRAEQPSAIAPSGMLVGDEARTQVLVDATDLTQRTLSYNYKTLDEDIKIARARMTKSFQAEYDDTLAQVRDNTLANKVSLQAVVVSASIITATEKEAEVLVFANQTTTAGTGDEANQQLSRTSLVVTLIRGDGGWLMSNLTALG